MTIQTTLLIISFLLIVMLGLLVWVIRFMVQRKSIASQSLTFQDATHPIQQQPMEAGNHQLSFQAADLRAGVYYLSLLYQGKRITQKMVLLN